MKQVFKITVFLLVACYMLLVASSALAQGNIWGETLQILQGKKGLVPCGGTGVSGTPATPCNVCHIFVLIQNIINLFTFAAMSLGTIAALVIGIRFLIFGSNEKLIQQTRQQFNWLVWGIVIVLGSWLFLNTLFNFVASGSFKAWNQIECKVPSAPAAGGGASGAVGGLPGVEPFQPGGGTFGGAGASGGWEVLDSPGYADGINTNTEG